MTVHHMLTVSSCWVFKGLWASPNARVFRRGPIGFHRSRARSQSRRGSVIADTICLGDGVTNGNKCVSSVDIQLSVLSTGEAGTDQAEGGGARGSTGNSYYFPMKQISSYVGCVKKQSTL